MRDLKRYEEAEQTLKRGLSIPGAEDCKGWIEMLNSLAGIYVTQKRDEEAKAIYSQAMSFVSKSSSEVDMANCLEHLSSIASRAEDYTESVKLSRRCLEIRGKILSSDSSVLARTKNDLAVCLFRTKDTTYDTEIESLYRSALEVYEKAKRPAETINEIHNLATLYYRQGRYRACEPMFRQVLKSDETEYGADNPTVAASLNELGNTCFKLNKNSEAETCYTRALKLREKKYGPNDVSVAVLLNNLGELYSAESKFSESDASLKRAITIKRAASKKNNTSLATSLRNLSALYEKQGRAEESAKLKTEAVALDSKAQQGLERLR